MTGWSEHQTTLTMRVAELLRENERLREAMIRGGMHKTAPCVVCGYNGPGYYQPDQHGCVRIAAGNEK